MSKIYTSFNPNLNKKSAKASGSATSPEYKQTIENAFSKLPGALHGSQTTPAYKQGISSAFQAYVNAHPELKATADAAAGDPAKPKFDPQNLPLDPYYDAEMTGLEGTHTTTVAGLDQSRSYALGTAGYSASYDDKGNVSALTYDPNNPYSQAAVARKRYQEQKSGTTNSMAARGQLYSGALINAQNTNDTNFARGEDARQKSLGNFIAQNTIAHTRADNAWATGKITAGGNRLGRATQSWLAQNT